MYFIGGGLMASVYDYCVVCEEELFDNEKEFNKSKDLYYHPICFVCLSENADKINRLLTKKSDSPETDESQPLK